MKIRGSGRIREKLAAFSLALAILLACATFAAAQTNPPVKIVSPANYATVSGLVNFTISVGPGVSWVDFDVDNHILGATPGLTKTWDTTKVAPGQHVLEAYAFAQPRQFLGMVQVVVTVGAASTLQQSSAVQITTPQNGSLVSGEVPITAAIATGVNWVEFNVDNSWFIASPPLTKTWNAGTAKPGLHLITVTAMSRSNTKIGATQAKVFVGTGVAITAPNNNATVSGPFSVVCDVSTQTRLVKLYLDGRLQASSPPYTFSVDAGTIADGPHTLTAASFDANGVSLGSYSIAINVEMGAKQYYVDPAGSDTNLGTTPSSPWRTIAHVNSINFDPGDTIYFKRGGIWRETLKPSTSGIAGQPITYSAYGTGNAPIISGADVVTGWSVYSGSTYEASLATAPYNVYVGSTPSFGLTAAASASSMAPGSWFWSGGTLYVTMADGSNPANHAVEAAVRRWGAFVIDRSYVTIDSLALQRTGGWAAEIISDTDPSQSTGDVVSNNNISQNGTGQVDTGAYDNAIYVNQAVAPLITDNTVAYAGGHNGINVQNATDGQILNNNVSHFNHSGIDMKYSDTMLVQGNTVHDSYGNAIYSENSSNLTIEENIAYNMLGTLGGTGGGIHLDRGVTGQIFIYNNSIYNTRDGIYLLVPATVLNNAINDTVGAFTVVSGGTYNYNDLGFNNLGAGPYIQFNGAHYTFATWRTLGGHANDMSVNPQWTSPSSADFTLLSSSPLINAGIDVGLDFTGSAPNIGAIQ